MLSAHMKNNNLGPSLTTQEQENPPAQPGGGADDGSMSTQERQSSSPSPHFSFDYKTIAQEVLCAWHCLTHPLVSLTSILFLSLFLSLNSFCRDIKDCGTRAFRSPLKQHKMIFEARCISKLFKDSKTENWRRKSSYNPDLSVPVWLTAHPICFFFFGPPQLRLHFPGFLQLDVVI